MFLVCFGNLNGSYAPILVIPRLVVEARQQTFRQHRPNSDYSSIEMMCLTSSVLNPIAEGQRVPGRAATFAEVALQRSKVRLAGVWPIQELLSTPWRVLPR